MPLPRPAELDPDDAPDPDEGPLVDYYNERAAATRAQLGAQLDPPLSPPIRARLESELHFWESRAAAELVAEHFAEGDGDRTLF